MLVDQRRRPAQIPRRKCSRDRRGIEPLWPLLHSPGGRRDAAAVPRPAASIPLTVNTHGALMSVGSGGDQ
jgi:hypothetical protein